MNYYWYHHFLFVIAILIFFSGCSKENKDAEISRVAFKTTDQQISTDNLQPVNFLINITPPAPVTSTIIVDINSIGGQAGMSFSTIPQTAQGQIDVPVNAGDNQASIEIAPVEEGIGFDNVIVDLEIMNTGTGLSAEGLFGVYASLIILNNKEQVRELPFLESFDQCESGNGGLPPGWKEEVVIQNSFGTGHWVCSKGFRGLECNAFISKGFKNDSTEVWLLTPAVSLIDASNPVLRFDVDRRFETGDFQEYNVKISTDFNGNNFNTANWDVFPSAVSEIETNDPEIDNYESVDGLDLTAYKEKIITIAFIYYAKGSGTNSTIFRLDNVRIEDAID
jgi:hypothetical protein